MSAGGNIIWFNLRAPFAFEGFYVPAGFGFKKGGTDFWSVEVCRRGLHLHPPPGSQPLNQYTFNAMSTYLPHTKIHTADGYFETTFDRTVNAGRVPHI